MKRRLRAGWRRSVALLAVILGLLALPAVTGCSNSAIATDLTTRLTYEGYGEVTVQLRTGSQGDVVVIRARGSRTLSNEDAVESLQTAVWNELPRRFDVLDIRVGTVQSQATYQHLSQRFGPRDRVLDERPIGTDVSAVVITVSIIVGLLAVIVAALAFMMFRRRRWEERELTERFQLGKPPQAGYVS